MRDSFEVTDSEVNEKTRDSPRGWTVSAFDAVEELSRSHLALLLLKALITLSK